MVNNNEYPNLCLVGPMVGRNPGYVPSQGERLSDLFQERGYPVISVSSLTNRYLRLADTVRTLIYQREWIVILIILVYSGPSFVVADIASQIGQRSGLPIVMSLHGGAMPQFMSRFPHWTRRVLSRADILVTQSDYLLRALSSFGFSARVIPNVIHLNLYPYRHRARVSPRLLWMRAFHKIYNPAMALRVLDRLRAKLPQATLVMAGQDKGLQSEMQGLASQLELQDAVRFPGFLNMAAKIREGDIADIFINTPHIDNRPVCVVEASAMGLPVVSTNVGGASDLLTHAQTGLLVPDDDVEAMSKAIFRLVEDDQLSSKLSRNGKHLAKLSAPDNVGQKWESLFTELLARRKQIDDQRRQGLPGVASPLRSPDPRQIHHPGRA